MSPSTALRSYAARTAYALLVSLVLVATVLVGCAVAESPSSYVVAPTGRDDAPGTAEQPFRTLGHALTVLDAGDTLLVRGGRYQENLKAPRIRPGTASAPVVVRAWPGERPVLEGLLWLKGASYWTIDGLNVTWNTANVSTEHMVKLIDGVGWKLTNSEIWGARSYAGVLVASSGGAEPRDWTISRNCIHDTYPSNNTNQDQLLYVNTGLLAGEGVVERNLFFNATNGMGVKLGGPSPTSGGAANVTVRNNTIHNTSQNMLVSWQSTNNEIARNLLVKVGTNYANIRGYQLTGLNNVARDNLGYDAKRLILNDSGYVGVIDAGNSFGIDPRFDSVGSCNGYRPTNDAAKAFGRYAGETAETVVAESDTSTSTSTTSTTTAPTNTTTSTSDSGSTKASATKPTSPAQKGYWLLGRDGGIFSFGDARFFGSTGNMSLNKPVVGMAPTKSRGGYWLVASDGGIFSFGDARFFGSTGDIRLAKPIVGMAATPTGNGYWLVASDGGVFAFGDAGFFGSTGNLKLRSPIVGMAATPTGQGYWMVAADGGVFAFGDALFHGSAAGQVGRRDAVAMAATPDGRGYRIAAADGRIFSYGTAVPVSSVPGDDRIGGLTAAATGSWAVSQWGRVFALGGSPWLGDLGGTSLAAPIVGSAAL